MTVQEIIKKQAELVCGWSDIKQIIRKGCESKIVSLEYNEKQRVFHVGELESKPAHFDWVVVSSQICEEDAVAFIGFIEEKYCIGRARGRNPDLETIQLELRLFFKQKKSRRKLT